MTLDVPSCHVYFYGDVQHRHNMNKTTIDLLLSTKESTVFYQKHLGIHVIISGFDVPAIYDDLTFTALSWHHYYLQPKAAFYRGYFHQICYNCIL